MSQRLHVGKTEENYYDCVLENEDGAYLKMLSDWISLDHGFFLSPWKIRIGDMELFHKISPVIASVFDRIGKQYPECIWAFYRDDDIIVHPTQEELDEWLKMN